MAIVIGVVVAVAGWLVNEFFARRAVRRNLRIEYLLSAYRRLEQASNRQMTSAHERDLEEAISDIQLLGSRSQVGMATVFATSFATDQRADTEPLLEDLRASLRRELQLEAVPRRRMWLRITRDARRDVGPEIGDRSWAIWEHRTAAVAANVRAAVGGQDLTFDESGAGNSVVPPGASAFVNTMATLAHSSPYKAVDASLQRVAQELVAMLERDGAGDVTGLNVTELAFLALERSLINPTTRDGIEGIAVMHTMASLDDAGRRLQERQAREYIGLAEGLLLALRLPQRSP